MSIQPRCPSLSGLASHGLWSLWDMLREYGHTFFLLGQSLRGVQFFYAASGNRQSSAFKMLEKVLKGADHPIADVSVEEFTATTVQLLKAATEDLRLPFIYAQIERLSQLASGNHTTAQLAQAIESLIDRIVDVLEEEKFLHIPSTLVKLYRGKSLFGETVETKFQPASEDIENAGRCLAVSQETAAVFHLMRAMECAVGMLATKLVIPHPDREWGKLLSDIHKKIEEMPKGDLRDSWSECHANLYHLKQAWRNKTMHPKATYTPEQAKEVFEATRVFMSQLATLV
jgi:hypothetical protein